MRFSIYLRLLAFSLGVALIPIAIAGAILLQETRDELKSSVNDELINTAQGMADSLDQLYRDQWMAPLRLLARTVEDPELSTAAKLAVLTGIGAIPDVVSLQLSLSEEVEPVVILQDGIAQRLRALGEGAASMGIPHGRLSPVPAEGKIAHGSVSRVPGLEMPLLNLVLALDSEVNGVRPLLAARIDLTRFLDSLARHPFARNGSIQAADRSGALLSGQPLEENALHRRVREQLASEARGAGVMPYTARDGREMLGGYALAQGLDWAVIVERDAATAYQPVRAMLRKILLWLGIGVAIALAGAWFFSRRLSRPIVTIEGIARRVGGGDFDVRVPALRRRDEIGELGEQINRMIEGLRERERVKDIFGRFQSVEVVNTLLETPGALELGGERRRITIMMTDLRGFTAIAERLPPEEVVRMLNHYFEPMVEVCRRHQGTINEIIGDAMLVLFGAPVRMEGHGARAVACAIEMQRAMEGVNRAIRAAGLPELEMGIGIHSGDVVVGNVGSERRAKFAVIGRDVNLAGRIESYSLGGQVLVSDAVRQAVPGLVVAATRRVQPKGVKGEIAIHEVAALGELELPSQIENFRPLDPPLPVRWVALSEKHAEGEAQPGELVALSGRGAELRAGLALEPLLNLRLNLVEGNAGVRPSGRESADIYAKVTELREGGALIRFTSLPEEVAARLA